MEELELEEGCWIEWMRSDGETRKGRVEKNWENKPFGEDNWRVSVLNQGYYQPKIAQIIRVFPKVYFKINPSKRRKRVKK